MASRTAEMVAALKYQGLYTFVSNTPPRLDPMGDNIIDSVTNVVAMAAIQTRQVNHLRNFAGIIARLEALAGKELVHESFSPDDEEFLDGLMQPGHRADYGEFARYTGWYPGLFYRTIHWTDMDFHGTYGSGANDALVADVHTDVPDLLSGDPGSVLHEAVGRVNLLMLAVDNGGDRFVCAGPVFSHYELDVLGPPRRLSDVEWAGEFRGIIRGDFPSDVPARRIEGLAPPLWTESYLVPAALQP
jgi:hypothetical protein